MLCPHLVACISNVPVPLSLVLKLKAGTKLVVPGVADQLPRLRGVCAGQIAIIKSETAVIGLRKEEGYTNNKEAGEKGVLHSN
jgi:hypothetical protein